MIKQFVKRMVKKEAISFEEERDQRIPIRKNPERRVSVKQIV